MELKTGMVLRRVSTGGLRAVLRAKPIRGMVHVYSDLGVDFETELASLLDPRFPLEIVAECANGPEARSRVDELCGRSDRIERRRERAAQFATRAPALRSA